MRWCSACGRAIEEHEVVTKRLTITPNSWVPGHQDRVYRCDVVRTGTVPGTEKPIFTPRGAVRAE